MSKRQQLERLMLIDRAILFDSHQARWIRGHCWHASQRIEE